MNIVGTDIKSAVLVFVNRAGGFVGFTPHADYIKDGVITGPVVKAGSIELSQDGVAAIDAIGGVLGDLSLPLLSSVCERFSREDWFVISGAYFAAKRSLSEAEFDGWWTLLEALRLEAVKVEKHRKERMEKGQG